MAADVRKVVVARPLAGGRANDEDRVRFREKKETERRAFGVIFEAEVGRFASHVAIAVGVEKKRWPLATRHDLYRMRPGPETAPQDVVVSPSGRAIETLGGLLLGNCKPRLDTCVRLTPRAHPDLVITRLRSVEPHSGSGTGLFRIIVVAQVIAGRCLHRKRSIRRAPNVKAERKARGRPVGHPISGSVERDPTDASSDQCIRPVGTACDDVDHHRIRKESSLDVFWLRFRGGRVIPGVRNFGDRRRRESDRTRNSDRDGALLASDACHASLLTCMLTEMRIDIGWPGDPSRSPPGRHCHRDASDRSSRSLRRPRTGRNAAASRDRPE